MNALVLAMLFAGAWLFVISAVVTNLARWVLDRDDAWWRIPFFTATCLPLTALGILGTIESVWFGTCIGNGGCPR